MKNVTSAELDAIKQRLRKRQEDRKAEADIRDAIALAGRKPGPFGEIPADSPLAEEKRCSWAVTVLLAVGICGADVLRRIGTENWLMILTLALIGIMVYGMRLV